MPDFKIDAALADGALDCIEEEDLDEMDDAGEVEGYDIDEENSLSRSMSQLTTREGGTEADDSSNHVKTFSLFYQGKRDCNLLCRMTNAW